MSLFRNIGSWVVVYNDDRRSMRMSKREASSCLSIFPDAKYITKIYGLWKRRIYKRLEMCKQFLAWRGISDPCMSCGGRGILIYNKAKAKTIGVCNNCWGSGDAKHPWANLDKFALAQRWIKDMEQNIRAVNGICPHCNRRLGKLLEHADDCDLYKMILERK